MSVLNNKLIKANEKMFKNPAFKNLEDYNKLNEEFKNDYEGTWAKLARDKLHFFSDFTTTLNTKQAPNYKWFEGGKINLAYNCVDIHAKNTPNKTAIIFEADNAQSEKITYLQLYKEVNKCANMLKEDFNIKKGDRIILYMPMIIQSVVCMLACSKIGAIHSIVFGGFSASALRDRINNADAKLVITADGAYRKGEPYNLKNVVDEALLSECESVKKVCIVKRNNTNISIKDGRDFIYNDLVKNKSNECKCEIMDSEDALFLLYTSGSTGQPKGVLHTIAGYLLWAKLTCEWVFDLKKEDTFWCSADIGWITGHTYSVYGPLSVGATTIIFEGVPTYPDASRFWDVISKHKVNQFYTAPTAIRLVHKLGASLPKKYDLSSLRVLGTVGEPIDNASWQWYYDEVGGGRCPIVDTWWQTETGANMIAPLPLATPIKPACATLPLPGIFAKILDEDGNESKIGEKGYLCITKPWPSMIRSVWKDNERFKKTYFSDRAYKGEAVYFSGDGAYKDELGYITITGRVDDVINKSGHRLGTAEIEDSINFCSLVSTSAVVSVPHDITGEGIFAFVVLKKQDNKKSNDEIKKEINLAIKNKIGAIAYCDEIVFVPDIPKTRSGKNMRRLLRQIARGEDIKGDISTLENPQIVEIIISLIKNNK